MHIWEIQPCRGDCNNSGELDAFDISAFSKALSNPAQYEAAFPGLEGSRIYHGSCDCDDDVDAFDISAFTNLLTNGCCTTDCTPCEGVAGPQSAPTPEEVAALYAENLNQEELAEFLSPLADLVSQSDGAQHDFWAEVLKLLGG